jgi:hypothetical protein
MPSCFSLVLVEKRTGGRLARVPTSLPFSEKHDRWQELLLWHPKHDAFALLEPLNRWENRLRFYSVKAGTLREIEIPDHVMNILGRIDALAIFRVNITRLVEWKEDELEVTWDGQVDEDEPREYSSTVRIRMTRLEATGDWRARLSYVSKPIPPDARPSE